jgi:hypothetical protein
MSVTNLFSSSTRKVYYRPGRAIAVIGAFGLFVLLLWKGIQEYDELGWVYWFFLAVDLASGALALYATLRDRVVISETGIEFYQVSYRHSTTWDNVERIERVQVGLKHFDALILREPAVHLNKLWAWRINDESWMEHSGQLVLLEKAIPLFMFRPDWRTSEIGQDMQFYVPRLFTEKIPVATPRNTNFSEEQK